MSAGIKCEVCCGYGLNDNHVTGEIECSACNGTGWRRLPTVNIGDDLHQILGEALNASDSSKLRGDK